MRNAPFHSRRRFLALAAAAMIAVAGPAFAGIEQDLILQLKAQGFKSITVTQTLLGRTRIIATLRGGTREIIFNPRTGEILRDLWTAADGSHGSPSISKAGTDDGGKDDDGADDGDGGDDNGGGDDSDDDDDSSGNGGSGGDDDDSDDDKDDDSDDDSDDDGGDDDGGDDDGD